MAPAPPAPPPRFTWPPAPAAQPAPPATTPLRARKTLRAALTAVEDVWLERSTATLRERMDAESWSPDAPGDYCPRCGTTSGPCAADDTGCEWCRSRELPWQRTIRLGSYEGLLRQLVLEVKFTAWRRLGTDLGRLLGASLRDALGEAGADPRRVCIVPVPMSFRRRMTTGIDHALVIARAAAAVAAVPVVRVLARRHGPTQLDVAPSERARNAGRSIRARRIRGIPWGGGQWIVVLLDDVRTTGATLTAAARALPSTGFPQSRRVRVSAGASPGVDLPQVSVWTTVLAVTPLRAEAT